MKRRLISSIGIFLLLLPLYGQLPEAGYFKYLSETFDMQNTDISEYLIDEMKFYLETFSDSPNVAEVLFMLGKLYEEEKDYPEAFTTYLKLKLIEPGNKRVAEVVPIIQQIITDKAERTFKDNRAKIEEYMNKQTSFSDRNSAYSEYIIFLYGLNIEDINEILVNDIKSYLNIYSKEAKNPDQILFWQAELFEKARDWDEAVAAYSKVKYVVPDSPIMAKTIFKIGFLQYEETKQYQEAKSNFTDVITNYSQAESAGDAQFYLAEMYEKKMDNTTEALTNYRLLVESYPKHKYAVEALKRVAEIHEDDKKYQEAINSYHQIFELYPENNFAPEALLEIESLYRRKLNDYQKSIEMLKLYANQYSSREDAAERLFDAADLHWDELKDKKAAIDTYNEVISKFPDSKYADKSTDRIADLTEE